MKLTLLVNLHVRPGQHEAFERYEQRAAQIMARYGGRIERRMKSSQKNDETQPDEIHIVTFPDEDAFASYRADEELRARATDRDVAILHTTLWRVMEAEPF